MCREITRTQLPSSFDPDWEFPTIGIPYFGVLIITRILLEFGFYIGVPFLGNSRLDPDKDAAGSVSGACFVRSPTTAYPKHVLSTKAVSRVKSIP